MKDYLHRQFMRFYYNGVFVQMQKKSEGDGSGKIVKSRRFSNLINIFNNPNNNNKVNRNINRNYTRQITTAPFMNNLLNNDDINILKKKISTADGFDK